MNPERYKYDYIYSEQMSNNGYASYGHSNHGARMLDKLSSAKSLLDVGCGHNEFVIELQRRGCQNSIGVDFSCPGADVIYDITDGLPFDSKSFEWVTAFDVLEHIRMEHILGVLEEMQRVSEKFCFSIAFRPSSILANGENLHPTVKPMEWWLENIQAFADSVKFCGRTGFFEGTWS